MLYLANAFSLNMLNVGEKTELRIERISLEDARNLVKGGFYSAVGHADTAAILEGILGVPVPFNRTGILLTAGDELLVAQYRGPRLPEGTTKLPEGATFEFYLIREV